MRRFTQSLKQLSSQDTWPKLHSQSRRTNHGSIAWVTETSLAQPQDGAQAKLQGVGALQQTGLYRNEPEDARLTGGTRSLLRRMLGLNIIKPKLHKLAPSKGPKGAKREEPLVVANRVA